MKLTQEQKYQIKDALQAHDMTMARFCRAAGIEVQRFYTWFYGGTGEKNCLDKVFIAAIEKYLGLKL
jgi:hypothetical protein